MMGQTAGKTLMPPEIKDQRMLICAALAERSDNPLVVQALEHLIASVRLAHGEEWADLQRVLDQRAAAYEQLRKAAISNAAQNMHQSALNDLTKLVGLQAGTLYR